MGMDIFLAFFKKSMWEWTFFSFFLKKYGNGHFFVFLKYVGMDIFWFFLKYVGVDTFEVGRWNVWEEDCRCMRWRNGG